MIITLEEQAILYQFIFLTNIVDINTELEFIPSSIVYEYVNNNPSLKSYKPIAKEMKLIKEKLGHFQKALIEQQEHE